MILLKEDFSLVKSALQNWLDGLNKELEEKPLSGYALEIINQSVERAERLIARIQILEGKK